MQVFTFLVSNCLQLELSFISYRRAQTKRSKNFFLFLCLKKNPFWPAQRNWAEKKAVILCENLSWADPKTGPTNKRLEVRHKKPSFCLFEFKKNSFWPAQRKWSKGYFLGEVSRISNFGDFGPIWGILIPTSYSDI